MSLDFLSLSLFAFDTLVAQGATLFRVPNVRSVGHVIAHSLRNVNRFIRRISALFVAFFADNRGFFLFPFDRMKKSAILLYE